MERPVVEGAVDDAVVVDAVPAVAGDGGVDDDAPSVVLGGDDAAAAGLGGGGLFP